MSMSSVSCGGGDDTGVWAWCVWFGECGGDEKDGGEGDRWEKNIGGSGLATLIAAL